MTAVDRFFYHSFPRPKSETDPISRGQQIFDSVLKHGLILAPEVRHFRESLQYGESKEIKLVQKRICFTELNPAELRKHAESFGSFALEWEIGTLRAMGAVPCFYVPLETGVDSLEGIASALLARIADIQEVLTRLESMAIAITGGGDATENLLITDGGGSVRPTGLTIRGARDLLAYLEHGHQPIHILRNAVQALAGYFYPVEDLNYTDVLGYYRQREWRIIGNMVHMNRPVSRDCSVAEQAFLEKLDPQFWARTIALPTGPKKRSMAAQVYPIFRGQPVIASVRRIIAPRAALAWVEKKLRSSGLDKETIALEQT